MLLKRKSLRQLVVIIIGCLVLSTTVFALTVKFWPVLPKESETIHIPSYVSNPVHTPQVTPLNDITEGDLDIGKVTLTPIKTMKYSEGVLIAKKSKKISTPRFKPIKQRNSIQPKPALEKPAQDEEEEVVPENTSEEEKTELLSRSEITQVMGTIREQVQDCYDQGMVPGTVDLIITVKGETGQVTRAQVSANSSTALCIKRLAYALEFPTFEGKSLTIRYPYSFK